MKHLLLASAGIFVLVSCAKDDPADTADTAPEPPVEAAPTTAQGPELGSFGIAIEDIKESVDPGDDFYRYVNGKWLDTFEIPEEFSNYGAFTVLFERSEARVENDYRRSRILRCARRVGRAKDRRLLHRLSQHRGH